MQYFVYCVCMCYVKDINKLGQQLQYCYSLNRRAPDPIQVMNDQHSCVFLKA